MSQEGVSRESTWCIFQGWRRVLLGLDTSKGRELSALVQSLPRAATSVGFLGTHPLHTPSLYFPELVVPGTSKLPWASLPL